MPDPCATAAIEFAAMADQLEATGQFRVLRRAPPIPPMPASLHGLRYGVVVDVETTGLDLNGGDAIIQIAILPFVYDELGRVMGAAQPFVGLEDPLITIPPRVTELTGLTLEDLQGWVLDYDEVEAAVGDASIVIAHHAAFDRKFLEHRFPFFERLPFGCSMTDIPWEDEGYEGAKLAYLMMRAGFFHDAHDAAADCAAVLTLLGQTLPKSGETGLSLVLQSAATPTHRIWAVGAPFEAKDTLRRRGYRWNPGTDGRPKAWFRDVAPENEGAERAFLAIEIYRSSYAYPIVTAIDAFSRFSSRA